MTWGEAGARSLDIPPARGSVRLCPGSASLPGTLPAAALVAGLGLRLVVGLLLSAPASLRLPAHMRTPDERRGPWGRGLLEVGDSWEGERREGTEVAGVKARSLGGVTLVRVRLDAGPSPSKFSTDTARPGVFWCSLAPSWGLDARADRRRWGLAPSRLGALVTLKGLLARRIGGLWTN